jgi:hypothetical protein
MTVETLDFRLILGWMDGITLCNHIGRLFEVTEDKNKFVAEMIGDEGGIKKVKLSWQIRLFRWEKEMLEACEGIFI